MNAAADTPRAVTHLLSATGPGENAVRFEATNACDVDNGDSCNDAVRRSHHWPGGGHRPYGMGMPFSVSSRRGGWTLIELLIGLVLIGLVTGLVVRTRTPAPDAVIDDTAFALARGFEAARAEAVMHPGDGTLTIDGVADDTTARFLALRLESGAPVPSTAPTWTALDHGIMFGRGETVHGPLGDTGTAIPRTAVRCDAAGHCDLGVDPVVTFYLTVAGHPDVVRAVTISAAGDTHIFRYHAGSHAWD
jgi:hypothetical protein